MDIAGVEHRFPGRTLVMGILNVTPDSFSDGGSYNTVDAAVKRGQQMAAEGADIIDVGGESTRPGAPPVPAAEESRRVMPIIESLVECLDVPVSIDTHKASVAQAAVLAGATVINDIGGLRLDPEIADVAAEHGATLILMHSRKRPTDMQVDVEDAYGDVVAEVEVSLRTGFDRACSAGVSPERIVLDPGIGFGKTVDHNLSLLAAIGRLNRLGRPVLIGASRKSFLGSLTGRPVGERLHGSLSAAASGVLAGAAMVRVHDVEATVDVVRVAEAIRDARGLGDD